MELIEGIFSRRSIRKYIDKEVSDEDIKQIFCAAMQAPSAVNRQPWHFILVRDRERLTGITEIHPYADMLKHAAFAILVLGDTKLENSPGYWSVDCGAATQNILLAAHGLGLGAVWLGVHPREERRKAFRNFFNLPDHIQPFALVSIGYPAEQKPFVNRYHREKIHYETW